MPAISPIKAARPSIGPPSWPPKTAPSASARSAEAAASIRTPTFQPPPLIRAGVSATTQTVRPPTSTPLTSPVSTWKASQGHLATFVIRRCGLPGGRARADHIAVAILKIRPLCTPRHFAAPFEVAPPKQSVSSRPSPQSTASDQRRRPGVFDECCEGTIPPELVDCWFGMAAFSQFGLAAFLAALKLQSAILTRAPLRNTVPPVLKPRFDLEFLVR